MDVASKNTNGAGGGSGGEGGVLVTTGPGGRREDTTGLAFLWLMEAVLGTLGRGGDGDQDGGDCDETSCAVSSQGFAFGRCCFSGCWSLTFPSTGSLIKHLPRDLDLGLYRDRTSTVSGVGGLSTVPFLVVKSLHFCLRRVVRLLRAPSLLAMTASMTTLVKFLFV